MYRLRILRVLVHYSTRMTNLETRFLEVLTREAVRFCSRVEWSYGFLQPRSRKCVRPPYGTFINDFARKALAAPHGLYDKMYFDHLHEQIEKRAN